MVVIENEDVTGLAVDSVRLYWTTRDGSVVGAPLDGSDQATALVTGIMTTPSSIAVAGGYVYWTDLGGDTPRQGSVMRVQVNNGTPELLAGSQDFTHAIAVDAVNAYWATYGGVFTTPLAGGTVTPIVNDGAAEQVGDIAVDGQYLYWVRGCPYRSPLTGGGTQALDCDKVGPGSIALDTASVYWTVLPEPCDTANCPTDNTGYVLKAPKSGGSATVLAEFEPPAHPLTHIAVDSMFVYWMTAHDVQRTPVNSGPIETLASGQGDPYALLLTDDYVYWASGPIGSYPAAIRRLPK